MKENTKKELRGLIRRYHETLEVMEHGAAKAIREDGRAYGGYVRMAKGQIQEFVTERLVRIAWCEELGFNEARLEINSDKIKIPICKTYVEKISDKGIRDFIKKNLPKYYYGLSVDKHIFVDKKFVMGVECKAYTENAMIKRILVDFHLLKTKFPKLKCYLFQLESQLGGDYGEGAKNPKGSPSTHSIMSYFSEVDLEIITLLDGERKVDRPINKPAYFKELKIERLENAVEKLVEGFREVSLA